MVEFAPIPVIIVKFRNEKEMQVFSRKILRDNRSYTERNKLSN